LSGLDKITDEIIQEANNEAKKILDSANAKSDKILAEGKKTAERQQEDIDNEANKQILTIVNNREAEFSLKRRQTHLEARQTAISLALENCRQYLLNLPENEYFALCIRLAASQALTGNGELIFNSRDKARIPESFAHLLNLALPEGNTLSVSDQTAGIDGGFVLQYGEIEENCSFSSIFRGRRDEFIDRIKSTLFER
jgi:V/A-type H+-transporting ATPase subunit E